MFIPNAGIDCRVKVQLITRLLLISGFWPSLLSTSFGYLAVSLLNPDHLIWSQSKPPPASSSYVCFYSGAALTSSELASALHMRGKLAMCRITAQYYYDSMTNASQRFPRSSLPPHCALQLSPLNWHQLIWRCLTSRKGFVFCRCTTQAFRVVETVSGRLSRCLSHWQWKYSSAV